MEGLKAGCIEALMLNHKGEVAECTGDNIFVVKNGVLNTPSDGSGNLGRSDPQRRVGTGRPKRESRRRKLTMTRHDIYVADECFLTGQRCRSHSSGQAGWSKNRKWKSRPNHPAIEPRIPRTGSEIGSVHPHPIRYAGQSSTLVGRTKLIRSLVNPLETIVGQSLSDFTRARGDLGSRTQIAFYALRSA